MTSSKPHSSTPNSTNHAISASTSPVVGSRITLTTLAKNVTGAANESRPAIVTAPRCARNQCMKPAAMAAVLFRQRGSESIIVTMIFVQAAVRSRRADAVAAARSGIKIAAVVPRGVRASSVNRALLL